jgi:hypothetical protein
MSYKPEDYLDKKVRCIFEPMISALLMDKPKEPVKLFFINFNLGFIYDRLAKKFFWFKNIWIKHGKN